MTPAEKRERSRLRSKRWRRAHGIGPRRPAQKPWLAEGISRSTWYRRCKQAREATARRCALASVERTFTRAEAFAVQLARDLERCAAAYAAATAIIGHIGEPLASVRKQRAFGRGLADCLKIFEGLRCAAENRALASPTLPCRATLTR